MLKRISITAAFAISLVAAQPASAGAVIAGFDSSTLAANDDGSTGLVGIGFSVNYFGVVRSSLYVNNNGNLTFDNSLGTYTPFGLGAGYTGNPIIAPFFADVDTRGAGSDLVRYGAGLFDGHSAFGANWVDVGYYGSHADKLNSFQAILVDRSDLTAGDFDIYFNYDQIQWETGDASGGSGGLGGTSAAAGFSNGTGAAGTYYQLPGSLVNGALLDGGPNSLVAGSNIGIAGRYLFQVRNGVVVVPGGVPEPATWLMMILGFGLIGGAMRNQKRQTRVRYAF